MPAPPTWTVTIDAMPDKVWPWVDLEAPRLLMRKSAGPPRQTGKV